MTFTDYLSALPLNDLKLIASTLGLRPKLVSRARLIREIPIEVFQPGFIESRIDALSHEEQDLLLAIILTGERGYAYDPVRAADRTVADRLYLLLTHGIIMGRQGAPRTPHYVVPADIRDILIRRLNASLRDRLTAVDKPPVYNASDALTFIRDLFAFLSRLRSEPARLTDRGVLFKRVIDTVKGCLEVAERHTVSAHQPYPARFEFLLRYCQARQLVRQDESRLCCSDAFEQWLHLPTTEKLDDLLAFWYGTAHHKSSRTASLLGVLQLCLDFDGIEIDAMTRLVISSTPGLPAQAPTQTHHRMDVLEALRELEWLGLLRLYGEQNGQPQSLTVTLFGRSVLGNRTWDEEGIWSDRFVVQPTYEMIVPRTLHLTVRKELEQCADPVSVDRTLTYRITKETIYRAGDHGMSGEAVIAFLRRHSEKAIPQNVEYAIREWGDAYGQVYFMDVFLLRTANPEIASHIKAHQDLGRFVRGEVAPDALIVERHRYREMMETLRQLGFMPKSQVMGMDAERTPASHPFARERFADAWTHHAGHRQSAPVIGIDECLPGYRLSHRLRSDDDSLSRMENTATMQQLSPKHTLELLELAINRAHTVLIDYYFGNRSRSHLHKIRPARIDRTRGALHVEAYSLWEEETRAFNIAHIKAIRIAEEGGEE